MANLFEKYQSEPFIPQVSNDEWDRIRKGIRDNYVDIEAELKAFALAHLAKMPGLANLVPSLSRELDLTPSTDLTRTVETILGKLDSR